MIANFLWHFVIRLQGLQRRMVLVVDFSYFFIVAICDLVHEVETIFKLPYLLTTSGNLI